MLLLSLLLGCSISSQPTCGWVEHLSEYDHDSTEHLCSGQLSTLSIAKGNYVQCDCLAPVAHPVVKPSSEHSECVTHRLAATPASIVLVILACCVLVFVLADAVANRR